MKFHIAPSRAPETEARSQTPILLKIKSATATLAKALQTSAHTLSVLENTFYLQEIDLYTSGDY